MPYIQTPYAPRCETCGQILRHSRFDVEEARELMEFLALEYGGLKFLARAYAERFGKNALTAERRFHRIRSRSIRGLNTDLLDELQVMTG